MKKLFGMILLMMLALGCATAYQPKGLTGGFSDRQVSEDEFLIQFCGNGFTSERRAAELAVIRSADICLQHGFGYFKFLDGNIQSDVEYRQHPGYSSTFGSFNRGRYYSTTTYMAPSISEIRRPTATTRIKCYISPPPNEILGKTLFDARQIQMVGKKKYGLE